MLKRQSVSSEHGGLNRLRKNSAPGRKAIPQGLKPHSLFSQFTARLKSCPDTKHAFFRSLQPVKPQTNGRHLSYPTTQRRVLDACNSLRCFSSVHSPSSSGVHRYSLRVEMLKHMHPLWSWTLKNVSCFEQAAKEI